MMKPDLTKLTRSELKKYIVTHPIDEEAIRELLVHRRNVNAKRCPYDMSEEEIKTIFRSKINQDK